MMNLTLRFKILLTIVGLMFGVLSFATLLFTTQTTSNYRNLTQVLLSVISPLNSIAQAVANNDVNKVSDAITDVKNNANVIAADVYSYNNNHFVSFTGLIKNIPDTKLFAQMQQSLAPVFLVEQQNLKIVYPIINNNQLIGASYVLVNLTPANNIQEFIEIVILISLVAIYFAMRLEAITLKPLINLVEAMQDVKNTNDYSIQVTKERNDEIGVLVDTFNSMMKNIRANEELAVQKELAEQLAYAAEKASEEKSLFLAAMSHELRNPLNGVIGMTQLLNTTQLSNDQAEIIETIKISGEALMSVINEILDISKIEAGKFELEYVDFNLYSLVEDVLEMGAVRAMNNPVEVEAFIDRDVPRWVKGDSLRIQQILNNLVSNAVKFTHTGYINIIVKLESQTKEEVIVNISVQDTGIGLSEEAQSKLFQAYTQAEKSISRRYGGTGLGLAISKRLLEMMKGKISVNSKLGQGSSFNCTIPLLKLATHIQEKNDALPMDWQLENKHVLCIDSNPTVGNAIRQQFQMWHLDCDVAINTEIALNLLAETNYHFVILDYDLLLERQEYLLNKILECSQNKEIIIILMLPLGLPFENSALSAKIHGYFYKPFRANKLMHTLETIFEKTGFYFTVQKEANNFQLPKGTSALIVDDNFVNRLVLSRILQTMNCETKSVQNGKEAINLIKSQNFDFIFMDCDMPELDGFMATQQIRLIEESYNRHSIIIAMTANALKGDKEKCLIVGMDDYITKPIDIHLLTERLMFWCEKIKE